MKCHKCNCQLDLWSVHIDDGGYLCKACADEIIKSRNDLIYGPPVCDCGYNSITKNLDDRNLRYNHGLWCQFREWLEKKGIERWKTPKK